MAKYNFEFKKNDNCNFFGKSVEVLLNGGINKVIPINERYKELLAEVTEEIEAIKSFAKVTVTGLSAVESL